MNVKELAGYAASAIAVLGGGVMLYLPPAALSHDATIGLAFSLITGGFAGFGVTVAVPTAVRAAAARGHQAGRTELARELGHKGA
jgi:hypothetical protein